MNILFSKAKQNIANSHINLTTNDFIVLLIDTNEYNVDLENDESVFDIPEIAIVAEKTLQGVTFLDGVFDADDLIFDSTDIEKNVGAIIIAKNDTILQNEYLVLYYNEIDNLPFTTTGEPITISWDNSDTKIFKL